VLREKNLFFKNNFEAFRHSEGRTWYLEVSEIEKWYKCWSSWILSGEPASL